MWMNALVFREVRIICTPAIKRMGGFTEKMALELGKLRWNLMIWRWEKVVKGACHGRGKRTNEGEKNVRSGNKNQYFPLICLQQRLMKKQSDGKQIC